MEKLIYKFFLFLSASLILSSSLLIQNCQSQWVWQNPLPHGNTVSIVKFVDKNTGWYFSGLSSNYKTTNGGINWFNENLPTSQTIVKADYFRFDSLNSLLVLGGATGAIVKSTNKGNNWILVASPSYNPVLDFHFFNASSGFAVTVYLYKTTDGGMSWDSGTGVERDHRLIYFLNDSVGWMCDYFTFWNHMPTTTYSFYKTTNSGNTWMPKSSTSFYTNANGFNNFIFKDSSEGLVEMYGYISKTTNSGVNWNNIYYGAIFNFINNTVFTAAGNKFVKSTDFGNTWNVIDTVYIRKINETCIEAVDNSDIYLGGTQGDIMKTSNGGVNWSYLNKTFYRNNLISIKCFDSLNLCAFAPGKYIFKSSNGGTNWRVLDTTLFGTDIISTIYFINKDTGWAGCAGGKLYRTFNGGNNWTVNNFAYPHALNSLIMFVSGTGYIIDSLGWVYKTINFGSNWNYINFLFEQNIIKVLFTDELTGFALGRQTMYKTTDGGVSWLIVQTLGGNDYYSRLGFYDNSTGYCLRKRTYVNPPITEIYYDLYKTINGGENWSKLSWLYQNPIFTPSDIFFAGNIIYILTGEANLYKSINGGMDWDSEVLCQPVLNSLTTYKKDIWVVGNGGTIIKGNQMVPVKVNSINEIVPYEFALYQNYPNPFNPVTKIRYDLPRAGVVRLAVYDVMGREVEMLVNARQAAGSYEAVWDGTRFASGVYFYRFTAEGYSETRKMLMIR